MPTTYIKRGEYNFTQNYIYDFDELIVRKVSKIYKLVALSNSKIKNWIDNSVHGQKFLISFSIIFFSCQAMKSSAYNGQQLILLSKDVYCTNTKYFHVLQPLPNKRSYKMTIKFNLFLSILVCIITQLIIQKTTRGKSLLAAVLVLLRKLPLAIQGSEDDDESCHIVA